MKASRSGAAAAEFALIIPVFTTLLFGGFEFGMIAYSTSALQLAANVIARDVAVNNLDVEAATEKLQPYLPGYLQGHVSMSMSQSNPGDPRLNSVQVQLQAPSTSATPISIVSQAASWTVSVRANVQQELPYVD